jgi:hypothetical protein
VVQQRRARVHMLRRRGDPPRWDRWPRGINGKHHEAGTKDQDVTFEHGKSQELERSKAKEPS